MKADASSAPLPDLHRNGLLKKLSADLQDELAPLLVPVQLKLGDVLYEWGAVQEYVYFPIDSIVSLL